MSGDKAQKEAAMTTASSACNADDSQNDTTMTKVSLACPADNCSKKLKTTQNLGRHMEKFHAVGQKVSNTVRNFLLSPVAGTSSAPDLPPGASHAPRGLAPSAPSAITPAPTSRPRQLFSPGAELQLQEEEDLLEAAKKEQDLYDELHQFTQNIIEPENEAEVRNALKEKLERYKTIMVKKDNIIKETVEAVKSQKLSISAVKHDAAMMAEIQDDHMVELAENRQEIENLNKENAKLIKSKDVLYVELETTRVENGSLNKDISDLKMQLQVKDGLVKELKETYGVGGEVTIVASTHGAVKKSSHECNACGKIFRTSIDLEKHIEAKHDEKPCVYCEKLFRTESSLVKHHKVCTSNVGLADSVCDKCNKKFKDQGLKRHWAKCQDNEGEFDCPDCGEIFESAKAVKAHQRVVHDQQEYEPVRSRIVCKHWKNGNCFKGDKYGFKPCGSPTKQRFNKHKKNKHEGS